MLWQLVVVVVVALLCILLLCVCMVCVCVRFLYFILFYSVTRARDTFFYFLLFCCETKFGNFLLLLTAHDDDDDDECEGREKGQQNAASKLYFTLLNSLAHAKFYFPLF